MASACGQVSR
jgi:hypothetical protein